MDRAAKASQPTGRLMVRSFSLATGVLAIAIAVLGFFPGYERYPTDGHPEVVWVANTPHGLALVMAIAAAIAAYIWRRPLLANALLGSVTSVGTSVFVLALTAPPFESESVVVTLPAAVIAGQLALALVVIQLVAVPVACGLLAWAARARRPDRIARARVHRIGRE